MKFYHGRLAASTVSDLQVVRAGFEILESKFFAPFFHLLRASGFIRHPPQRHHASAAGGPGELTQKAFTASCVVIISIGYLYASV